MQRIRDTVIHLMRGQVYHIAGKLFFTMGGATSHDIEGGVLDPEAPDFRRRKKQLNARGMLYRVNHVSWWKEELPNATEYETARKNLDVCGRRVDYIITHCCPSSIADMIGGKLYTHDHLTDFFEGIKDSCEFRRWFFGHYHDKRVLMQKYILLYENIVQIEPTSEQSGK